MNKCRVMVKVGMNAIEEVEINACVPTTIDAAKIVLLAACAEKMKLAIQLDKVSFSAEKSYFMPPPESTEVEQHAILSFATTNGNKAFVLFIEA